MPASVKLAVVRKGMIDTNAFDFKNSLRYNVENYEFLSPCCSQIRADW
jgi:hypothetical protein